MTHSFREAFERAKLIDSSPQQQTYVLPGGGFFHVFMMPHDEVHLRSSLIKLHPDAYLESYATDLGTLVLPARDTSLLERILLAIEDSQTQAEDLVKTLRILYSLWRSGQTMEEMLVPKEDTRYQVLRNAYGQAISTSLGYNPKPFLQKRRVIRDGRFSTIKHLQLHPITSAHQRLRLHTIAFEQALRFGIDPLLILEPACS